MPASGNCTFMSSVEHTQNSWCLSKARRGNAGMCPQSAKTRATMQMCQEGSWLQKSYSFALFLVYIGLVYNSLSRYLEANVMSKETKMDEQLMLFPSVTMCPFRPYDRTEYRNLINRTDFPNPVAFPLNDFLYIYHSYQHKNG